MILVIVLELPAIIPAMFSEAGNNIFYLQRIINTRANTCELYLLNEPFPNSGDPMYAQLIFFA